MLPIKGGNTTIMNANKNLIVKRWQEETALNRFQMIAPLTDQAIDEAKRIQLRKEIAKKNDLSYKTIKRYEEAYARNSFEGLKPRSHTPRNQDSLPGNYEELLQEAIQLRREVPTRSVETIITILEITQEM